MKKVLLFVISIALFCYINSIYATVQSKTVLNTWIKIQTGATISPKIAKIKPKVIAKSKTTNTENIKTGNLIWSEEYGSMTYTDATKKCNVLSPEWKWHIPTDEEMGIGFGGNSLIFKENKYYWSAWWIKVVPTGVYDNTTHSAMCTSSNKADCGWVIANPTSLRCVSIFKTPIKSASGISIELARQIVPDALIDSTWNIVSYRNSWMKTEAQQIEFLTKAKVSLGSESLIYCKSAGWAKTTNPLSPNIYMDNRALSYWSFITWRNWWRKGQELVGIPRTIDIPAWAWINTDDTCGMSSLNYHESIPFSPLPYVYKDGGAIDFAFKTANDVLRKWDYDYFYTKDKSKADYLGIFEGNLLSPFNADISAGWGANQFDDTMYVYTPNKPLREQITLAKFSAGYNQHAINQEIYNKMMEIWFDSNDWQIKINGEQESIVYVPSLLDHDTDVGFGGNRLPNGTNGNHSVKKGTYIIYIDTSFYNLLAIHGENAGLSDAKRKISINWVAGNLPWENVLRLILNRPLYHF